MPDTARFDSTPRTAATNVGQPIGGPPHSASSSCAAPEDGTDTGFAWIDCLFRGAATRYGAGAPVLAGLAALHDWSVHLAQSPGRRMDLANKAAEAALRLQAYAAWRFTGYAPDQPPAGTRFQDPAWTAFPFDILAQGWLGMRDWWHDATSPSRGLNTWSNEQTAFWADLMLDALSPANLALFNPEVIHRTLEQSGANLQRGWQNWLDDLRREIGGRPQPPSEGFLVGKDLAVTPGKVVYQNDLIELIQYAPQTETVQREPLLIIPAWIMKYYILDLSPHNSLVRWLVAEGFQVFMVSWKNPRPEDGRFRLNDYLDLGIRDALDAVRTITKEPRIHACGYCLGGTLLSIQAARMARDGVDSLATVSLLAAQTDFSEPGDIRLFVDEAQATFLEDMMELEGIMPARFMSDGFKMLRSETQVWDAAVRRYLLGEESKTFDLLAWNEDATRMPCGMMRDYLRGLYLENQLALSRYRVDGRVVSISDIRAPVLAVGTTRDHVAPWKSVFKITRLARTDVTFILADGGHNAGIVTEPGHPRRHDLMGHRIAREHYLSPEAWEDAASRRQGSWWTSWRDWLIERSGEPRKAPARLGYARAGYPILRDAPGKYVLDR